MKAVWWETAVYDGDDLGKNYNITWITGHLMKQVMCIGSDIDAPSYTGNSIYSAKMVCILAY